MDVSVSGCTAGNSAQQQTCKRKFFQWAVKWFYANILEDSQEKPDVALLASLLQSIGFKLRKFEKSKEASITDGQRRRSDSVKVTVECGNTGMRACLELDDVKCQCPKPEDENDASFWSVSGTGPTNAATIENANKFEESGSNLLPPISKDTAKMINDIVYHLFNMIGDKSLLDANQNSKSRSNLNLSSMGSCKDPDREAKKIFHGIDSMNFVRSHTQPEIVFSTSNTSVRRRYGSASQPFKKDTTSGRNESIYEDCASLDSDQPRPSPPKIVSSPVFNLNELCSSLDSISVHSEEDDGNLATYLVRANRSIQKALDIIAARRSPNQDQVKFLKPTGRGSSSMILDSSRKRNSNSACSTGSLKISPSEPNSRPGSSCSMPGRGFAALSLPKSTLSSAVPKSPTSRRSVGSSLTRISSISRLAASGPATGTSSKNLQPNASGASKIPGRRKSFHSLGQLKLAAVNAKNTAVSVHKDSTSPTSSKERFKNTGACQSGIPKFASSLNQSTALPTLKVAPLKPSGQKETKENARRSLGNPRYSFSAKHT